MRNQFEYPTTRAHEGDGGACCSDRKDHERGSGVLHMSQPERRPGTQRGGAGDTTELDGADRADPSPIEAVGGQ